MSDPPVSDELSESLRTDNNYNIPQYDGNISSLSENSISVLSDAELTGQPIETLVSCDFSQETVPPPVWFESYTQRSVSTPPVRQTVKRNSKLLQCLSLPIISVSNVCSLLPKLNSFKNDILVIREKYWAQFSNRNLGGERKKETHECN